MQYTFPIKIPYPQQFAFTGSIQKFGSIGKTIWSIRPQWVNQQLKSVEIIRKNVGERIYIELYLRTASCATEDHCEYGEPFECINSINSFNTVALHNIFKAILLQNEKSCSIETNLSFNGFPFQGYIVIYSSSPCIKDDQYAVFTYSSSDPSKLSNDFLRLLDNPNFFADATLKCGTAEIPVHKCVLSVRSPVFAAMFSSQMKEGLSSTLLITDIELDVLQAALRYIYSGMTDNLTDVLAGDLLFVADKYQLDELKSVCIAKLKSSVSVDNIFRILVLGELHDKGLKARAIDFFCRYDRFSDLEEREEWESLEEEYPKLALEVTKSIVKFLQQ